MASRDTTPAYVPKTIERIKSGIPGFDQLIQGGFVNHSTTLVRGGTGTGKTLFCLQYLYKGIREHNEPGVFISFAETEEEIIQHGNSFGWDLEELIKKKQFAIIQYAPHEIAHVMEEGGGSVRDTIESLGAKRLVIDSITAYSLLFENEYKADESILDLFQLLKKWGCTSLVTSEYPVYVDQSTPERLGFLTDGILNLYYFRVNNKRIRGLEVLKMRDTHQENTIRSMEVSKTGIIIGKPLSLRGQA